MIDRIRQLWHLLRDPNETPAIVRSREVEAESEQRLQESDHVLRAVDALWHTVRQRGPIIVPTMFPEKQRRRT